jgi:hypothetical protein
VAGFTLRGAAHLTEGGALTIVDANPGPKTKWLFEAGHRRYGRRFRCGFPRGLRGRVQSAGSTSRCYDSCRQRARGSVASGARRANAQLRWAQALGASER